MASGRTRAARLALCGSLLLLGALQVAHGEDRARPLVLWHSYRGAEEAALLQTLATLAAREPSLTVEVIAVPNEALASKLTTAIPRGHGPDLFLFAHERIGGWARAGLLASLDAQVDAAALADYLPETIPPLRFEGRLYGLPLAVKSAALFYNRALVPTPPATTDELFALVAPLRARGVVPLVYESANFYFHAAWHLGFGAELLAPDGSFPFESPASIAALGFVADLQARGVVPEEVSGALVASLFNDGKAALAISGPWFTGELARGLDFGVAPLPLVSATGRAASPLLTDEAVLIPGTVRDLAAAVRVARWLTGPEAAITRAVVGRQVVAARAAWDDPRVAGDPVLAGFRAQLATATPMDNRPEMRTVWEPAQLALKKVLRGAASPAEGARAGARRHASIVRPDPPPVSPTLYIAALAVALLAGAGFVAWRVVAALRERGAWREARRGWGWIGPAMAATAILILFPFVVGLALAFFSHREGNWSFVGLGNFADILSARGYGLLEPLSFYYALLVTLLWTVLNLALHVGIGLALALLLARPVLALRPVYRVLLVIPWAVPNYITALLWKTMFHKQQGAINGLLGALGFGEVSWFSSFPAAFFANLCTNAWLGFPFMMVVALGALQSIPKDLYEAADVDGATPWAKFRHITLPLLRPAMIPAVLLGLVWTFNQFNVVYLVSGGEPDNGTDILISEAYRWAFARQEQYGYAAAYAALIFVLLLGWSIFSARLARRVEEAS